MSLKRKALITVNYDRARHTYTSLGAYLVLRETRNGLQFFIEMLTTGALLHQAGVRHSDRLVVVNGANVEGLDFDNLLNAIKSLVPLVFAVEREHNGTTTPIVCILDIAVGDDLNPYAKFIGFFWNTTYDAVQPFIPLDVPSLSTYSYVGQDTNVTLKTTVDGEDRWLAADGQKLYFTTTQSRLTYFTKYRYVQDSDPSLGKTPVVFSPTDQPDQCLSANTSSILKLESFDEGTYKGSHIASNERFLFQESQDIWVVIESTTVEGYYIARDVSNDNAVMGTNATLFDPPQSSENDKTDQPAESGV